MDGHILFMFSCFSLLTLQLYSVFLDSLGVAAFLSTIVRRVFNYCRVVVMVLCASYNLRAHSTMLPHAGEDCRYELPSSVPSHFPASKPISLSLDEEKCSRKCISFVRTLFFRRVKLSFSFPIAEIRVPFTSHYEVGFEVVLPCNKTFSSSSRSSAEREIERQQRRQLLDASLLKMRASNNIPLRKHLLVYNIVKQLQRDLDLLDDEELYCNLMDESYGERMDIDERRWPFGATSAPSATLPACAVSIPVTAQVAPPQQEERRVAEDSTSLISKDLDMDVSKVVKQEPQTPGLEMWSWGDTTMTGDDRTTSYSNCDIFESIQDDVDESFVAWSWTVSGASFDAGAWWTTERSRATSLSTTSRFEPIWSMGTDPLGATNFSRFELQHLFPSQVLLQA
uniref:SERTA domain-containing protein n=1 Tax=Angiostrongylus cantonensis TaxID=6313 RepID=A0A0K0DD79_ANGCA